MMNWPTYKNVGGGTRYLQDQIDSLKITLRVRMCQ